MQQLTNQEIVTNLKSLDPKSSNFEVDLLLLMREVKDRGLYILAGFSTLAHFCSFLLNITEHQAWRRSQAVNVIERFSWALDMLARKETNLTQIAMLAPKVTRANEDIIREFMPGKSKTELKDFLDSLNLDGSFIKGTKQVEVRLKCPKELVPKLHQAFEQILKEWDSAC